MTSIRLDHHRAQAARTNVRRQAIDRTLLAGGIAAAILYVCTDILAAMRYPGYRMADQAISELSAIGAPTRTLWVASMILYGAFAVAFAIGVLRVSAGNRMLRATGILLLFIAISGFAWHFFPMHVRHTTFDWRDTGHIVLSILTVVGTLAYVGVGALALGRGFRIYSFGTLAALLIAGTLTFMRGADVAAGNPTPGLGIIERVNVWGMMLWSAVLAVMLRDMGHGPGATGEGQGSR